MTWPRSFVWSALQASGHELTLKLQALSNLFDTSLGYHFIE
jgi:hypothetical protein